MLSAWLCSVAGLLIICHACVTFRMDEGHSVYAMTDDPMDKCIAACYVCFLRLVQISFKAIVYVNFTTGVDETGRSVVRTRSRLRLSRLGKTGKVSALVLPSGDMAALNPVSDVHVSLRQLSTKPRWRIGSDRPSGGLGCLANESSLSENVSDSNKLDSDLLATSYMSDNFETTTIEDLKMLQFRCPRRSRLIAIWLCSLIHTLLEVWEYTAGRRPTSLLRHEVAWCSTFSCLETSKTGDSAGFQHPLVEPVATVASEPNHIRMFDGRLLTNSLDLFANGVD
ncbi:hypothetical protein CLF_105293 [Clonorchis sinensis]|uniref:Uncharacterized protein n=1 Tax=Clonorchis sinensis TaxID=79923 RepID=G7YDB1_CLOSI|nr:hypothetical protein CLF_105293 [Clonorchis sinensis]